MYNIQEERCHKDAHVWEKDFIQIKIKLCQSWGNNLRSVCKLWNTAVKSDQHTLAKIPKMFTSEHSVDNDTNTHQHASAIYQTAVMPLPPRGFCSMTVRCVHGPGATINVCVCLNLILLVSGSTRVARGCQITLPDELTTLSRLTVRLSALLISSLYRPVNYMKNNANNLPSTKQAVKTKPKQVSFSFIFHRFSSFKCCFVA